jgi:hypothetical protein
MGADWHRAIWFKETADGSTGKPFGEVAFINSEILNEEAQWAHLP